MNEQVALPKVLVVEDEPSLVETLEYSLSKQGYAVSVATDGLAGVHIARREQPDVIILDLMLPRMDGFEVCRVLRREMNTPILMLTARTDEVDRVVGLEVGADDYLTKPFSMRELTARVKALLRRVRLVREEIAQASAAPPETVVQVQQIVSGNLAINLGRHEVCLEGGPIHLRPKEFDLLVFLMRNRGLVLSRELILARVWGWEFDGGSRTVDVHVRWLREKIEREPSAPTRIVTVRGSGYRFDG